MGYMEYLKRSKAAAKKDKGEILGKEKNEEIDDQTEKPTTEVKKEIKKEDQEKRSSPSKGILRQRK